MDKYTFETISSMIDIPKEKLEKVISFNEQIACRKDSYENIFVSYKDNIIASYYHVDSVRLILDLEEKLRLDIYDKDLNKTGCINSIKGKRIRLKIANQEKNLYITIYE